MKLRHWQRWLKSLVLPRSAVRLTPSRPPNSRSRLRLEGLEERVVFHAGHLHLDVTPSLAVSVGITGGAAADTPSLTVPAYNSLPGARAALYLDFNGHFDSTWGSYSNIDTPGYDQDGDTTSFSTGELANIATIWQRVAEDFAPFNINVTTVEPSSFANGTALRVAIGGTGSWMSGTYGGVAYIDSFTNSIVNTAYVFSRNISGGAGSNVSEAVSHEAGHAFGLQHQSSYSASGQLIADYYTGPGDGRAPIMGVSYGAKRSLWWNGTSTSATTYQDDMTVIARSANGFGYRADEAGGTPGTATAMSSTGTAVSGAGVITTTTDQDYWSLTTGPGEVSFAVTVPQGYNNLDAKVQLVAANGSVVVAWTDPSTSFGATLNASVAAGTYYVVVASHGGYGDVGQYAVSGTIVPINVDPIKAPTGLTATASAGRVSLAWTDNADNETRYVVERSTGSTWTVVANLGANATSYADTSVSSATTYAYRVRAANDLTVSPYSSTASATTPVTSPGAPSNLTVTPNGLAFILRWRDNSTNETGFRIQRSTDGVNWTNFATLGVSSTALSVQRPTSGTIYYRVRAVNAVGESDPTNVVAITSSGITVTFATAAAPAATSGRSSFSLPAPVDGELWAKLAVLMQARL